MDDKDKVRKLILDTLEGQDLFLLNAIYPKCVQLNISDDYVKRAIGELENENLMRTENSRGEFWQLKIISTKVV